MNAKPIKILVVDDEPPIRRLLRVGLATQGYVVIEATNGKTAIEQLGNSAPDLVILDLGLPDIQGHDLLQRWRAEQNLVPIIVLSSRTDEGGIVEALELGADDYVTKPFGVNELLARIRVALRHRLQQQGEKALFRTGDLSVDLVRRIVKLGEQEVKLSPKEYEIIARAGSVCRQGAHAQFPAEAGLGRNSGRAISSRLREATAPEDRAEP